MFYIITYPEPDLIRFKNKHPNIEILPTSNTYSSISKNKTKAVLDFCNSKSPDDIILYLSLGNFILLDSKELIQQKFKSLKTDLLFSKRHNDNSFREKYIQDKLFNSCDGSRLNINFYIGTARKISMIWQNYLKTPYFVSELEYIARLCHFKNEIDIKIDDKEQIFYNYNPKDKILFKNKKLYVNQNLKNISFVTFSDVKDCQVLKKKYNLQGIICNGQKQKISFAPEIILLVVFIVFICLSGINIYSIMLVILFLFLFLEYFLYVRFLDVNLTRRFLSLIIDAAHSLILIGFSLLILYLFILMFLGKYNIRLTLFLNLAFCLLVFQFFVFRRCGIQVFYNKITNTDLKFGWGNFISLFSYPFSKNIYNKNREKSINYQSYEISYSWMNTHKYTTLMIFIINLYLLVKIR